MTRLFLGLPAPAKLNLFLHVIGRRADGYHELQSAFVPIGLMDLLDFERRDDGVIERTGDVIGPLGRDLCVRAAQLLQAASGTAYGAGIEVTKRIPAGSGMGGGSSDAATTLIALNRLWDLGWPRARLIELGATLGADVPFFLGASAAFVEGIGERLTPIEWPPSRFAVIHPQIAVSTAEIFNDPGLTGSTKPTIIAAFSARRGEFPRALFGANDLEAVVRRRFPGVDSALKRLGRFGPARMTGSGSAVFVPVASAAQAQSAIESLPAGWEGWAVRSLSELPLAAW
ncbi:MAG TPA: 4-(cytidine 5'-diphospho)-2-C-methyl-D-erythritol kinase [Burkholderiaceae bacterium]|nr:4-(cytidine 5'-diphospho)-2-C-methyl-D-erythritol kinase [Burkholderiaceae bacterium]